MKVKVNKELCIGCGACQAIAPSVFEFNDEGLAEAKEDMNCKEQMDEELKEEVMDALEGCPTGAIFEEEEKNEK